MSTTTPINSSSNTLLPKFTYDPINYKRLIFASSAEYCRMMQPRECKAHPSDPVLRDKCVEMYRECMREAILYEQWSRMN